MPTQTYNEYGNYNPDLTTYLGDTLVNTNGYSGVIDITAGDSSIPTASNSWTPNAGNISWMGTLEYGNATTGTNYIRIDTNSTDLGLYNFEPGNCAQDIFFAGSNDSISMSSYNYVTHNDAGQSLDLSGTTLWTYEGSSSGWQVAPATIFGTDAGNDTFKGSAGTNVLYEGTGNSSFYQSAGNDLIACKGGNSVYYAKDAATSYQGGFSDSSGNTYLNDGSTWLFTENGKTIELVNVPTVSFDGVTYSDTVDNPTPTASSASAHTSARMADATPNHAGMVDLSDVVGRASLHHAMMADFGGLAGTAAPYAGAAVGVGALTMDPSLAAFTSLLSGSHASGSVAGTVDHHPSVNPLFHLS